MKAILIFEGLAFFILAFGIHIAVWRVRKIRKEILGLFVIFLILTPPAILFYDFWRGRTPAEALAAGAVYLGLALAYLQTYPVLEADIPTFRILMLVHASGGEGIRLERIVESVGQAQALYLDKVSQLEGDALVTRKDGCLVLTRPGVWIADLFIAYRRLWGLETGLG